MYKIIALDMDGTLLNNNQKISDENKIAIKKAKEKGVKVVLSTGRPLKGIERYLEELNLINDEDYAIAFNGSLVQKTKSGEILAENRMTFEDLIYLYNLSKELNINIHFLTSNECYTPCHNPYSQMESDLNGIPLIIEDFNKLPHDIDIVKIMFVGEENKLNEISKNLSKELHKKYNIVRSHAVFLEFLNKKVSKGFGVKCLVNALKINKEDVICVGDAGNDIDMIKYAGLGVAMGNAFPEVKEVSDYITKTNEEHGVAHVINKFILNNN